MVVLTTSFSKVDLNTRKSYLVALSVPEKANFSEKVDSKIFKALSRAIALE